VNHFPLTAIGSWRDGVQVYGTASADTICSRCDERFTVEETVIGRLLRRRADGDRQLLRQLFG
jgi:hypothetical protein